MPAPYYHPNGDPFLRAHWHHLIMIFLLVVIILKLEEIKVVICQIP